jgi:hypothetical protein
MSLVAKSMTKVMARATKIDSQSSFIRYLAQIKTARKISKNFMTTWKTNKNFFISQLLPDF